MDMFIKQYYYSFLESDSWFANFKRHLTIRVIGFKYRKAHSSLYQSLMRGKKTEIDTINGYTVTNGKKYNVQTPINARLVEMIKEVEDGKRKIDPMNLEDASFAMLA